jgi:lysylphosphatidylglycerol synthetase-like protein (DUF2156 family)
MMNKKKDRTKLIKLIRWLARIASILVLALAIAILVTPDTQDEGEPLSLVYWILMIMWLLGVFGLLMAWRWELAGACIAIAALIFRDMFYFSLSRRSFVDFKLVWLPILIPALLFIVTWWMDRGKEQLEPPW